jgi:hypothetical protein
MTPKILERRRARIKEHGVLLECWELRIDLGDGYKPEDRELRLAEGDTLQTDEGYWRVNCNGDLWFSS